MSRAYEVPGSLTPTRIYVCGAGFEENDAVTEGLMNVLAGLVGVPRTSFALAHFRVARQAQTVGVQCVTAGSPIAKSLSATAATRIACA